MKLKKIVVDIVMNIRKICIKIAHEKCLDANFQKYTKDEIN